MSKTTELSSETVDVVSEVEDGDQNTARRKDLRLYVISILVRC